MNFLTAKIVLDVDDGKLNAQLDKVKRKVMKSTGAMEKSYKKQSVSLRMVEGRLKATMTTTTKLAGWTVTVKKELGRWSAAAWLFHLKMKRNYLLLKSIGGITKTIGSTFTGVFEKMYSGIKKVTTALDLRVELTERLKADIKAREDFDRKAIALIKLTNKEQLYGIKLVNKERLHGIKVATTAWSRLRGLSDRDYWLPKEDVVKTFRVDMKEVRKDVRDATTSMAEMMKQMALLPSMMEVHEQVDSFDEGAKAAELYAKMMWEAAGKAYLLSDSVREASKAMDKLTHGKNIWELSPLTDKGIRKAVDSHIEGQKMHDVAGVIVEAYRKIFSAAKWAFEGILDITTSVFNKIFDMSIWVKTGIIAAFVGMYYKVTQAAMDAEDALSFNELGATRTALKRLKDALTEIFVVLGKPFLQGIQALSSAIAAWLEKSTPMIAEWAEKWVKKLVWLENAFIDWVSFLATDLRGGVTVALRIVVELFKGLAESLVAVMHIAGVEASQALVKAFVDGLAGAMSYLAKKSETALKWLGKKLMKSSEEYARRDILGLLEHPAEGVRFRTPGSRREITEQEKLSSRLKEIYGRRAEKVTELLESMPTWGDMEIEAARKAKPIVKEAITAMEEHRMKMMERGGTLSDMQHRLAVKRITLEMEQRQRADEAMIEHRAKLLEQGGTLWAMEYRLAAEKIRLEIEQRQRFDESLKGIREMIAALDFEYNLIGKSNEARERAVGLARFQAELAEIENLSLEQRNIFLDEYTEKLDRNLDLQRKLNEELDKSLTGWAAFANAIEIWMHKAGDWGKRFGEVVTNAFDTMADGLADALMGMTMDWKAFGRMFIKQLLVMIIKLQIAFALQTALGFWGGFGGGQAVGLTSAGLQPGYVGVPGKPPGMQHGGEVLETGLAKVHKGERFSGVNNEMGFGNTVVNISDYAGVDIEVDEYKDSDQRIIDVSIGAASGDGTYRRTHKIG